MLQRLTGIAHYVVGGTYVLAHLLTHTRREQAPES